MEPPFVVVLGAAVVGGVVGATLGFLAAIILMAIRETKMVDPPQGPSANGDGPQARRSAP
jgi:hypothetical protein